MSQPIYLDYNATTPVDKIVLAEMLPFFTEKFGNASSKQHVFGWDAEEAVDLARDRLACMVRSKPNEITFTSSATESINTSIIGIANSQPSKKHIITTKTEHKAVLDCCDYLSQNGYDIDYLEVNTNGLIELDQLERQIKSDTLLVSIMHANNETGVIQPIEQISAICRSKEVCFLSDTTQSVGKIPVNVRDFDLAVMSGHKMYGPKGVGALYINKKSNITLKPLMHGGGQEKGLRPGTTNVPGIVGLGKAAETCNNSLKEESIRLNNLRTQLEEKLMTIEDVFINGANTNRLPNVSNVTFKNIDGSKLIHSLRGLAVSQGSACTSAIMQPSHVLIAMGLSNEEALSSLRISLGRYTTEDEVSRAVEVIEKAIDKLRVRVH